LQTVPFSGVFSVTNAPVLSTQYDDTGSLARGNDIAHAVGVEKHAPAPLVRSSIEFIVLAIDPTAFVAPFVWPTGENKELGFGLVQLPVGFVRFP